MGGSDDQCGCNNNLYKWCLTRWPKKVVSNISNKISLQSPSGHCRTYLTTNFVLKASFPFIVKLKNKSSWDKIVWKSEKRFLLWFHIKGWDRKFQNGNFFCPSISDLYFTESEGNWYEPNNYVNQIILLEPEIFSFLMKSLSRFSLLWFLTCYKIWDSIINFKLCF